MSEKTKGVLINAQGVKGSLNTKILDENHHLRSTFKCRDIQKLIRNIHVKKKKKLVQFQSIRIEQTRNHESRGIKILRLTVNSHVTHTDLELGLKSVSNLSI